MARRLSRAEARPVRRGGDNGSTPTPPYFRKWKWFTQGIADFYGGTDMFTPDEPWTLFLMRDLSVAVAGLNSTLADSHLRQNAWVGEDQKQWFARRMRDCADDGWLRLAIVNRCPAAGAGFVIDQDTAHLLLHGGDAWTRCGRRYPG